MKNILADIIIRSVGIGQVSINDSEYPKQLLKIKRPPAQLYFRGDISIINETESIAVIGSRHVSDKGIKLSYQTGYEVAKKGLNVVNGLALGCDTHALKGALAANGKCIAVMPCGLDQIVPKSNIKLAEELLGKGGCFISEYPIGTLVQKYRYVERDRLQSGISDGVIVIEAEENSGTMHTVDYSFKQGKCLACYDSRQLEYASGNRWMEKRLGVEGLGNTEDLETFIQSVYDKEEFQQLTLNEVCKALHLLESP